MMRLSQIFIKKRLVSLFMVLALSLGLVIVPIQASGNLTDIKGSWAEDQITSLNKVGIIDGYPDGTFKPDANVTRAEFAKLISRAFGYAPKEDSEFIDLEDHWAKQYIGALADAKIVNGYPDGKFKPYNNITRAEMVAMLSRVANLGTMGEADSMFWEPSFADVNAGHWAFRFVEIAKRLDIIPVNYGLIFQPDKPATRAETAYMISELRSSQFARGTITNVTADGNLITLHQNNGSTNTIQIGPQTVVYRNGSTASSDKLMKNDQVLVVGTSYGSTKFVMAEGLVTKDDITQKVSSLTNGILTPDQVDLISEGKWDEVGNSLTPAIKDRMEEIGLTKEEADTILAQEWEALPDLGKTRLSNALSKELGISSDLVASVLDRDWEKAKTYAQLDAAQMLLGKLLKM